MMAERKGLSTVMMLAGLSLVQAMQGAALLAWALSMLPLDVPLMHTVFPEWRHLLRPEWEMPVYRVFVFLALGLMAFWVWRWQQRINDGAWMARLRGFLTVETLLTVCLLATFFKLTAYTQRPDMAHGARIVIVIVLILSKIWGMRTHGLWGTVEQWRSADQTQPYLRWWAQAAMLALIAVLLWIPNPEAVVARNFVGEQFHHNDSFIMGPGWAYVSGNTLDVDTISQYGIGFVAVIANLSKIFRGFSYLGVLLVMVSLSIVYYGLWFWLLCRVLGSTLIAAAVLLLGMKWQMFHAAAYPLVFTYGSQTPVRFLYDIVYFYCLWQYFVSARPRFLLAAAAAAGFGIYYLTSEGVYATAALYALGLMITIFPSLRSQYPLKPWVRGLCLALPPLVFLVLLRLTVGPVAFSTAFWGNLGEFIQYFLSGFGLEPIYKTLLERNFLQALMGIVIPSVYVMTVLITGAWAWGGKAKPRDMFFLVLCLYGLGTFHYYVARSVVTSYYTVGLPFAFVLGYWVQWALEGYSAQIRRWVSLTLAAAALTALMTTHMFMSYPNMLNLSHDPMTDVRVALPLPDGKPYFNHLFRDYDDALKLGRNSLGETEEKIISEKDFSGDDQLVSYYAKESDFSADVAMIDSLTDGQEKVALISSFEVPLLMQAHRRPYFYYFPLVISRPMNMRMFTATSIYTKDQMKKVIDGLERDKPPYVFMEKIFLNTEVPKQYLVQYPTLILLIDYVAAHYQPYQSGHYLEAMKRVK